jgi:hypothetical protein
MEQARKNNKCQPCAEKRESQFRKRPDSLMKDREGFLKYLVASADHASAPDEHLKAYEMALEESFDDKEGACEYTWVNLCEQASENKRCYSLILLLEQGGTSIELMLREIEDPLLNYGEPLYLDYFDPLMEDDVRQPSKCIAVHSLYIDQTGMRFDKGGLGVPAISHPSPCLSVVHARAVEKIQPQFKRDEGYPPFKAYKKYHASALATMQAALHQNSHH